MKDINYMNKKVFIIIQIISYLSFWGQISEKAYSADLPKMTIDPSIISISSSNDSPKLPNISELLAANDTVQLRKIRIGIIVDNPKNNQLINTFKGEIHTVLDNDYEVIFPTEGTLTANGQVNDINSKANLLLNDKNIDIIISLGEFASNYFNTRKSLSKPVISAINFPSDIGSQSGNLSTNLNFIPSHIPEENDLATFYRLVPFKNLTILVDEQVLKSFPRYAESLQTSAKGFKADSKVLAVNNNITAVINNIPSNSDAIYISSLPALTPENFQILVNCLNARKLPTFSYSGKDEVQKGILATAAPNNNQKIARQTAINIERILNGEKPSSIKSKIDFNPKLVLNQETAKKIGYLPDWKVKTEALLINNENTPSINALSISDAIKEAVTTNLDILANAHEVNASKKEINQMYSNFIPHIDSSIGYAHVGDSLQNINVMGASLDLLPADSMYGNAKVSQLIYSDKALAGITIKKRIYEAKQINNKEIKLDIAANTADSYINLLKINNFIKVQRSNLELLKSNLEQAKVRKMAGASNPGEIYRWQAEISSGKKNVLDIENQLDIVRTDLNRILNRQLSNELNTKDVELSDPILLTTNNNFIEYIENPYKFKFLRDFIIQKTIAESTEIQKLDKIIQAKERELLASKRDFWTPEVGAESQIIGFTPSGGFDNHAIWYAGVRANLPNFDGGAKIATYQKLKEELEALKIQRESVVTKINERSQIALLKVQNSYPNIKLTSDASINAHKSLDLLLDNYKKGTINVYDVINGQNTALSSDLLACNAKYDFISNLIEFQRSIGIVDPEIAGKELEKLVCRT